MEGLRDYLKRGVKSFEDAVSLELSAKSVPNKQPPYFIREPRKSCVFQLSYGRNELSACKSGGLLHFRQASRHPFHELAL
jgi:hypothetical protein